MAAIHPFITATEVITTAYVNTTVNTSDIKDTFIEIAQEKWIRPILGNDFYDELVTENDATNLSAVNQNLMDDHIKPTLSHYIKYEMIINHTIDLTNKGSVIMESDFSRPTSSGERTDFLNATKSHADALADKLNRFINDNSDDYPLYSNVRNRQKIVGGILLPQSVCRYCKVYKCTCKDL